MSDKLRELEAKRARCLGTINTIRLNMDLVLLSEPGLGNGLVVFENALKVLDEEIARLKESEFQKAKREFDGNLEFENLNGTQCRYFHALEKCRPWVIRRRTDGLLFTHRPGDSGSTPMMFATRQHADRYFRAGSPLSSYIWEIVQWEGQEQ